MTQYHEPWSVKIDADGVRVVDCDEDEVTTLDHEEAQRIVACINTLAGIPNEQLAQPGEDCTGHVSIVPVGMSPDEPSVEDIAKGVALLTMVRKFSTAGDDVRLFLVDASVVFLQAIGELP